NAPEVAEVAEVDEVVVTFFRAPHSYTGEDVIEISAHGNPLTLKRIVETAKSAGARIAAPGEFTLRAVAHGKMDLVQAEAVRDFIDAQTEQQARTAMRQMEGGLSKHIRPVKEKLIDVIAHLEAGIDFAEDDVDVPANTAIAESIQPLADELLRWEKTFEYGRMLNQGLLLAILGKPNVGKSSLFNQLIARDRAIVTEIPGTTRDVLTETISMDGVPLRFADTAGVRQTTDRVESIGVSRTFETLADADLALVVLDGSASIDDDDRCVLQRTGQTRHLIVINKADLPQIIETTALNGAPRVAVSARTGEGLDDLRDALKSFLLEHKTDVASLVLTSARQHEVIGRSARSLGAAAEALNRQVPHEMVLLDLYSALSALDELTGDVVTEDILDRIFSTFCIGK
ncbi:MAG TPA: tRNA uridine-5-carboxymethylaminomethyl(34) synthesis GTPase MnmE, partial [Terriglobia bacterium]|nr:tRNA uridine-5-carboxymethylaminomethyl(34) synthesis GTPase MnmE [Terriglobia bacterium]